MSYGESLILNGTRTAVQPWPEFFQEFNQRQERRDTYRRIGGVGCYVLTAVAALGAFGGLAIHNSAAQGITFVGGAFGSLGLQAVGINLHKSIRERPDLTQPAEAEKLLNRMSQITLSTFAEIQSSVSDQLRIKELLEVRLIDEVKAAALDRIVVAYYHPLEAEDSPAWNINDFNNVMKEVIIQSPLQKIVAGHL